MQKIKNEELQRLSVDAFRQSKKTPIVIVLDNVRSALNVGSIFRTADAFRIEAVYLCGYTAVPPNRDILKTALGATDTVSWKHFDSTGMAITDLKTNGYTICSIEQVKGSIMLHDFKMVNSKSVALVFGNEVDGVQQHIVSMSDLCIEIPQSGTKHSLNISVATGIVVWELFTQILSFRKIK